MTDATPYADAAEQYLELGWDPLPVLGTDKAQVPRGFTGYSGRKVEPADVKRWVRQHPERNIALRLPPDLVGIDVDAHSGKPGGDTLAELEAKLGALPHGPAATAREEPSARRLFRIPPGAKLRTTAGPGIDIIQHHHRYVVAAPSIHHTGAQVRWIDSADWSELDHIPEPGDFPELPFTWLEELSVSGSAEVARDATSEEVERFLAEHTDAVRPGWLTAPLRHLRERCEAGASRHDATLSVLCQLAREAAAGAYPAADAVEGARELWAEFVTSSEPKREAEFGELFAWAVGQLETERSRTEVAELREKLGTAPKSEAVDPSEPWPKLQSLDPGPSEFPLAALPRWLREFTAATAEALQVPAGLAGVMALGTLAALTTGRVSVKVRGGWTEPLNLWVAAVLEPGERKSPTVATFTAPLRAAERELAESTADERGELAARRRVLEDRAKKAELDAAKVNPEGLADALTAANDARREAEEVVVPAAPRLLASDVTPEAVVELAAAQGGALALVSDEPGPLADMGRRYSAKGSANLDAFLCGWSGGPYRVDRLGREAASVESLNLSLCVAAQPEAVRSLFDSETRGRGVVGRVLWCWPQSPLGGRNVNPDPVPEAVAEEYVARIADLARQLYGSSFTLELSAGARSALREFEFELEPRLHPERGDLGGLDGWASKLAGEVVRLAGVLHVAEFGTSGEVSADTLGRAIDLGRFFTEHALRTWEELELGEEYQDAAKALRWLHLHPDVERFTTREVQRGAFSNGGTSEQTRSSLEVLAERGMVRRLADPPKAQGGRPSEPWEVHPDLRKPRRVGPVGCVSSSEEFEAEEEL